MDSNTEETMTQGVSTPNVLSPDSCVSNSSAPMDSERGYKCSGLKPTTWNDKKNIKKLQVNISEKKQIREWTSNDDSLYYFKENTNKEIKNTIVFFKKKTKRFLKAIAAEDYYTAALIAKQIQVVAAYKLVRFLDYFTVIEGLEEELYNKFLTTTGSTQTYEPDYGDFCSPVYEKYISVINICLSCLNANMICDYYYHTSVEVRGAGWQDERHILRAHHDFYIYPYDQRLEVIRNDTIEPMDLYAFARKFKTMMKGSLKTMTLYQMLRKPIVERKLLRNDNLVELLYSIVLTIQENLPLKKRVRNQREYDEWIDSKGPENVRLDTPRITAIMNNTIGRLFSVEAQAQGIFDGNFTIHHQIPTFHHDVAKTIKDAVQQAYDSLSEHLIKMYQFASSVISGLVICILLWYLISYIAKSGVYDGKSGYALMFLSFFIQTTLTKVLARKIINILDTIIAQLRDIFVNPAMGIPAVAQYDTKTTVSTDLISSLITATSLLITGRDDLNFDKITKRIGAIPIISKGISSILNAFSPVITYIKEEVMEKIFGIKLNDEREHPDLERFHDLMKKIVAWSAENAIERSGVIQATVSEAEMLALKLLQTKGLGDMRASIMKQHQILTGIIQELGTRGIHLRGQRHAPVIIYLYGDTGCGKSTILETLAMKIVSRILDVEEVDKTKFDPKDLIYSRMKEQEFWDGYHGQLVTLYDDFAQSRDFAQCPNLEIFEVIRVGNTAEMPLHMADLADKNTTYFKSRVVIITSNQKVPKIESLVKPEAVYRRIDLAYEVTLDETADTNIFNPLAQDFTQYRLSDPSPRFSDKITNGKQKMDDIVDQAIEQYNKKFMFERTRSRYQRQLAIDEGFAAEAQMFQTIQNTLQYMSPSAFRQEDEDELSSLSSDDDDELYERRDDVIRVLYTEGKVPGRQYTWQNAFKYHLAKFELKYIDFKLKIKNLYEEHKTIFALLGTAALVVGATGLVAGMASLFTKSNKSEEQIIVTEAQTKYENTQNFKPNVMKSKVRRVVKAQNQSVDETSLSLACSLLKKNIYSISVDNKMIGCGVFLAGKIFMYPRHFLNAIDRPERKEVVITNHIATFTMFKDDFMDNTSNVFEPRQTPYGDIVPDLSVTVFKTAHQHKNISNHFARQAKQDSIKNCAVALVGLMNSGDNSQIAMWKQAEAHKVSKQEQCVFVKDLLQAKYQIAEMDTWEYAISTRQGDCGSLLMANTPMMEKKILGMHNLGVPNTDRGFSIPIYYEDVIQILENNNYQIEDVTTSPEHSIEGEAKSFPVKGDFDVIGTTKDTHLTPPTTNLRKTPLHPDLTTETYTESKFKPALLHPIKPTDDESLPCNDGDKYNPLYARLEKYGRSAKCVHEKYLEIAKKQYIANLVNVCVKAVPEHYKSYSTFEEAVIGTPGDKYLNSINRSTSPGYGWKPKPGKPGKTTWFGTSESFDLSLASDVKQRCEETIELARQGKRNTHVFKDSLKDEKKPIEKAHKTRVFSGSSMDYYIVCKQFYQGIVALLTKHRNYTGISVGTNVHSNEWTTIVNHLTQYTEKLIAGDFENFDSSLLTQILWATSDVLNSLAKLLPDWTPEHDKIRTILFADLVNSFHQSGNILYAWTHSLPSGHYLTAIANSIFVNLVFRYLIVAAHPDLSNKEVFDMLKKLRMVAYGDDHIVALPPLAQERMNQNTLPSMFAEIGMTYTDEKKTTNEIPDFRYITDITYLKRSFRYEDKLSRYLAPLNLDVVLEMPLWQRKTADATEELKSLVRDAIYELALHGQDCYDKWTEKIRRACLKNLQWQPDLLLSRLECVGILEEMEDNKLYEDEYTIDTQLHSHKCFWCGCLYTHRHNFHNPDHPQFKQQCPNPACEQYHHGVKPKDAILVQLN